jgi:hypothetical protein
MVVIRRELPRTSSASLAGGRSHRTDEGSPFRMPPRPRSHGHDADCLRALRGGALALDLKANGPDKAEQLAPDGGDDVLLGLAAPREATVTTMPAMLRLPGDRFDRLAEMSLAPAEGPRPGRG